MIDKLLNSIFSNLESVFVDRDPVILVVGEYYSKITTQSPSSFMDCYSMKYEFHDVTINNIIGGLINLNFHSCTTVMYFDSLDKLNNTHKRYMLYQYGGDVSINEKAIYTYTESKLDTKSSYINVEEITDVIK